VLSNANGLGGTPTWTQLAPAGGPPSARAYTDAVYDAINNRMIIFGGENPCSPPVDDVWVLSNANGLGGTPTWTQLAPTGGPPSARILHTAVYDAASNRMIVFGGSTNTVFAVNDVWVLSNANGLGGTPTWTQLTPSGTPPAGRNSHSAVLDPISNRMTVFGGITSTGLTNDVWVLSNANGIGTPAWTPITPSGTPPAARQRHTAVYKFLTNRMTVFGGGTGVFPTGVFNDTWVLTDANGVVPPVACQPGDEDNGKGMVADENGNNGGEFDDNECDNNHNLVHKDPNHSMMFTASAHGPVAFSGNGLVATSVGQGIANGQPVNYVLVQTGGPAPYVYSLTLSDASGVIYRRNGQLIYGVINLRHR
jgi:hypothetical protein